MANHVSVILDVDTGNDDALALGFGVLDPEIHLVAATTVAGNAGIGDTTRNTLTVLDWFDATHVPVYRGASRPLTRPLVTIPHLQGIDGLGDAHLQPSRRTVGPESGPEAIVRLSQAHPGQLTLVCVGPLTNLALALNLEPTLPDLVSGVVVMGGAFHVPGNITDHAEFNIHCDPEAAALVFAAAGHFKRFTAIGLDVCHQVALVRSDYETCLSLEGAGAELFTRIARRQFEDRQWAEFYLYDPLALAVAATPDLITTESVEVEVDLGDERLGQTQVVGSGPVEVAVAVDSERFTSYFKRRLGLAC